MPRIPVIVRAAGFVVALGVGFGLIYAATANLGSGSSDPRSGEAQVEDVSYGRDGLLSSNRDYLGICVSTAGQVEDGNRGSETVGRVAEAIRDVIPELEEHWAWVDWSLSEPPPRVAEGCDTPSALYEEIQAGRIPDSLFDAPGRRVEIPSMHKVQVFVVEPAELERFGGRDTFRLAMEEKWCEGHTCFEVTTGVYITEEEALNPETLSYWLKQAIGLE